MSSVEYNEDEQTLVAVDGASVAVEPHKFVGVGDVQNCLVFRANIAALNTIFRTITYQVTLVTRATDSPNDSRRFQIDKDERPTPL